MSLKKVILVFVTLILVSLLIVNTHFTIENKMQIGGTAAVTATTLPPPPGVPSFEQPSDFTTETEIEVLKMKLADLTALTQRVSATEGEISQLKQKITNFQQQLANTEAQVQAMQAGTAFEGKAAGTSAFGIIIDIILILAIGGIVGYYIYTKKKQEDEAIKSIIDYMKPYLQQGYTQQQLQPMLKQAGYTTEEVNKALSKMNQPSLQKR